MSFLGTDKESVYIWDQLLMFPGIPSSKVQRILRVIDLIRYGEIEVRLIFD